MGRNLPLHEWHTDRGARPIRINGAEVVASYGEPALEYAWLRDGAALVDLSCRDRLCVLGADRTRFLNGQVTNDVSALAPGDGCYAAVCSAKGRAEGDAFIHRLDEEWLLDTEPGCGDALRARLERYLIADDVELADAGEAYGLLSVLGPRSGEALAAADLGLELPRDLLSVGRSRHPEFGELFVVHQPRVAGEGWEIHVGRDRLGALAERLRAGVGAAGGGPVGWEALEIARIEDGFPRFGADFDATTLPLEAGLESRAISGSKGCYVGQEILGRLQKRGSVAKRLWRLRVARMDDGSLPGPGDKLRHAGREVGWLTSVAVSPRDGAVAALGYVRREAQAPAAQLEGRGAGGAFPVRMVAPAGGGNG